MACFVLMYLRHAFRFAGAIRRKFGILTVGLTRMLDFKQAQKGVTKNENGRVSDP
jgi:hypothetical protein